MIDMLIQRILIPFCLLLAFSCNNKSGNKNNKDPKDSLSKIDSNKMDGVDDNDKKLEKLVALTPLTAADLEKLLPLELSGASRSDISQHNNLGTAMVIATYTVENSSDLKLTIIDCGGSAGAGVYSMMYTALIDEDRDSETEYTKTIDFNNRKAIEICSKPAGYCRLTWFLEPRYILWLEGETLEIVMQAAKRLKIK